MLLASYLLTVSDAVKLAIAAGMFILVLFLFLLGACGVAEWLHQILVGEPATDLKGWRWIAGTGKIVFIIGTAWYLWQTMSTGGLGF